MADDGGGTAQQTAAVERPFSWFYAINRSLKNNDQKGIPLDDRDWAKARDVSIVERSARAGDMPFVTNLRASRFRSASALFPNRERGGAQYDEDETDGAAS